MIALAKIRATSRKDDRRACPQKPDGRLPLRGAGIGHNLTIERGDHPGRQLPLAEASEARDKFMLPLGNINDRPVSAFHPADLAGKLSPMLEKLEHLEVDPVHLQAQSLHLQ